MQFRSVEDALVFAFRTQGGSAIKVQDFSNQERCTGEVVTVLDLRAQSALILKHVELLTHIEQLLIYSKFCHDQNIIRLSTSMLSREHIIPKTNLAPLLSVYLTRRNLSVSQVDRLSEREVAFRFGVHQSSIRRYEAKITACINELWNSAEGSLYSSFVEKQILSEN